MSSLPPSKYFPPVEKADEDGLVLFGGRLTRDWLLDAYRHGIFPWPIFEDHELLAWWSPDPRAVLEFEDFHVPRRLCRTIKSKSFEVTCDVDFAGVIRGCATVQDRDGNTWLFPEMIDAYCGLHRHGHAHSIEVWQDGRLVGGTYGVAIGGLFAAESKFYLEREASKVGLVALVSHLQTRGYQLLDVQQWTAHTAQFGVKEIPRNDYLERLYAAIEMPVTFGERLEGDIGRL